MSGSTRQHPTPPSSRQSVLRASVLVVGAALLGGLLYARYRPASDGRRHPHDPRGQGGIVRSLGDDRYHVEFVVLDDGTIELLLLGGDESRIVDVPEQTLTAYVKAEGDPVATAVELVPAAQPGDASGHTSRWSGSLPVPLRGRAVAATVPVLRIGRERFRVAFSTGGVDSSDGHVPMPRGVAEDERAELYFTAAGRYTKADIEANDRTVPAEKYDRFVAQHDVAPKSGDVLCPVTRTKANPECTWTVGGRSYQFCCPPCIDEFVKLAKEHPDRIRPPDQYVQQ